MLRHQSRGRPRSLDDPPLTSKDFHLDAGDVARFRRFAPEGGTLECWEWQGAITGDHPQPMFWVYGHGTKCAYRVAFFLAHGWMPEVVRHTCDNSICCNPAHLEAGTQKDNVADMLMRGRHKSNKGQKLKRLTKRQCTWILKNKAGLTVVQMARKLKCHRGTVYRVLNGHAPDP